MLSGIVNREKWGNTMFTSSRFLCCNSVLALTGALALSQSQTSDTADVLARYRESLSYFRSVSLRAVVTVNSTSGAPGLFPQTLDYVFRYDNHTHRAEWVGRQLIRGKDGQVDPWASTFIKEIADGSMCVSLESDRLVDEGDRSRRVILWYNYQERLKHLCENPNYGGPLFGRMYGSGYRSVADLLAGSPDLHIRSEREAVNGVVCLVLEGRSPQGRVAAWIAPEKGYSAVKWSIEKRSHDLFDEVPISTRWPEVESGLVSLEVKELQEIPVEGKRVYIPRLATFTHVTSMRAGTKNTNNYEYKVNDIQVKPDFASLGAFKIELPEGIRVFNRDTPDVRFYWKDGRPQAAP